MPSANCSLILLSDIYVRRAKSALLDVMCQNFPQCVKTTLFTRASTYFTQGCEMYLRSTEDNLFYQPKKGFVNQEDCTCSIYYVGLIDSSNPY